jgi:hypothetical protein
MANLNTAQFTLTGMTEKRSLGARLDERFLTVKDFGATGDGTTNDRASIQAAFDYCFGTEADPHGESDAVLNKVLFFPAGDYKVAGAPLQLNNVHGGRLIGAGSHQTRIFWSGAEVTDDDSVSALLEGRTIQYMNIEGMTLDASGIQDVVYRLMSFPALNPNGGTGGSYRDVHFTNGAITGVLGGGQGGASGSTLCSEQTFTKCRFTNCPSYGVRTGHQNALNYSFFSCYFANCGTAYSSPQGGAGTIRGCRFHSNTLDIACTQAQTSVEGCYSTSRHFASTDGVIKSCRHVHASPGVFWTPAINHIPVDGISGPPWVGSGTSTARALLEGNYSSNGYFHDQTGGSFIHLMANTFDNPNYLDDLHATVTVWEDGAKILP